VIGKIFHKRYEILEKLGEGGTAIVYKARDILLNRPVTLKILRGQYADDEEFVQRFRREAQAVAGLSHPNIVSIYDVVFKEDMHYLVMEYVDGRNLKEYIKNEAPLSVAQAVDITIQILKALEQAHKNGIIHRDIKSHNILLTKEGQVKVTDFGIALTVNDVTQTYNNNEGVMGSVHYMSPEQVKGGTASEKSDLYSVGVVLYEMLTGQLPYSGESAISVAMQHVQGDVMPPQKINPNIPVGLSFVVIRAMRKNPDLRYNSTKDMKDSLQSLDFSAGAKTKNKGSVSPAEEEIINDSLDNTMEINLPGSKKKKFKSTKKIKINKFQISPLTLIIAIVAILAVIVVVLVFNIVSNMVGSDEIPIPSVVGMNVEEAKKTLLDAELDYSITLRTDEKIEIDQVISQSPSANQRVKAGRVITLVVSEGPAKVPVPNVVGMTKREAEITLNNKNLIANIVEEIDGTVAVGTVISQSPVFGETLNNGGTVTIKVSKGREVLVPKLTGLTLEKAKEALAEVNLKEGMITRQESTQFLSDVVIEQEFAVNTKLTEGDTVDLVVSSGPGPTAKTARVTYEVQNDENEHAIVIEVTDDTGTHVEYRRTHQPGDLIVVDIPFYNKGVIKIYKDGDLVYSQNVPQE